MVTLVIGGACSGKSEYAESCLQDAKGEKVYLATMTVPDEESRKRVLRHRRQREGKHFRTVECPYNLLRAAADVPEGSYVLLEGIGTLAANELFQEMLQLPDAKSRILRGIDLLSKRAAHLVIVSDEVNRAGFDYEGDTMRYLQLVGEINQELGHLADRVVEMVCGIPVERKSGTEITYEILKFETRDRSRLQMA